jgi:hypothetical protein
MTSLLWALPAGTEVVHLYEHPATFRLPLSWFSRWNFSRNFKKIRSLSRLGYLLDRSQVWMNSFDLKRQSKIFVSHSFALIGRYGYLALCSENEKVQGATHFEARIFNRRSSRTQALGWSPFFLCWAYRIILCYTWCARNID